MGKLRILVVEDSLTVRRRLCDVLAADPGIEVAGETLPTMSGLTKGRARA